MGKIGMKMRNTPAGIARRASGRRAFLDGLASAMHADYSRPMSFAALEKKWNHHGGTIRQVFIRNGLNVRPFKELARQPNGSPARYVPKTTKEIDAIIASCSRIKIPAELKFEWRRWSLARKGWFIRRMWKTLKLSRECPRTRYSSEVEPFNYTSLRARSIAAKLNAGRPSRQHVCMIRICSQGVIYKGKLYFWAPDGHRKTGAYYIGPWVPGHGRPPLHHIIWQEHNGRDLKPGEVVRHADRNRNNFAPSNLILATRNDVARENQAAHLLRKSRGLTQLLLNRSQSTNHGHTVTLNGLRRRHAQRVARA